jgi:hypothetical protein
MLPAVSEASNARAARVLALVWLVLVPLWWFGVFVGSMSPEASRRIAIDLDGYFLPRYVWESGVLARGVLPLWNPYELAGVPALGVGQGAVLYPPRMLLFAVLPPGMALHAFFVLHYLLLGVGSYAALRALGLAWPGAALGTVIVACQPFMLHGHYAPHWISNFVWTPIAIAAFVRTVERPGVGAAAALAAALTMQVYAGYPEYAFDTVLTLAVLLPFVGWRAVRTPGGPPPARVAGWLAAAALTTVLATAVQWVALLEAARESVRAAGEYQFMFGMVFDRTAFAAGLRGWVDALGLLLYVPPLGWILLGVGLLAGRTRHRAALVALAVLAWAAPTWLRDVPPFSLFRGPLCWHSILHVPLAALAGAGLDRLVVRAGPAARIRPQRVRWALLGLAALALVPLLSARAIAWTALGLAGLALAVRRSGRAGVALVLVSALGAVGTWVPGAHASWPHRWAGGQPTYPRVAEARAAGEAVRSACGRFGTGRILAPRETWLGAPLLAQLTTPQGYPESLAPRRTSRLLDAAGLAPQGVFPLDRDRLATAGPLLALLDVRCMVLPADWTSVGEAIGFARIGRMPDGRVVLARDGRAAVMARRVEQVTSDERAFTRVSARDFDPVAVAIVVGAAGSAAPGGGAGRVEEVARPDPGRIVVRVDAPAGGYLVVPETWYPGWRGTVDGVATPVERADYAFLGVRVPADARIVALRYEPRGFGWAEWATLAGIGMLLGAAVAPRRSGRNA